MGFREHCKFSPAERSRRRPGLGRITRANESLGEHSVHPRLSIYLSIECLFDRTIESKRLKLQFPNLPSRVLATHLILGQKVKVTGSQSVNTYFRRSSGRREFALYCVASVYIVSLIVVTPVALCRHLKFCFEWP